MKRGSPSGTRNRQCKDNAFTFTKPLVVTLTIALFALVFAPAHAASNSKFQGTEYRDDGLTVTRSAGGARLRCLNQRLDGKATDEGLWLTSTVTNQPQGRFRVVATSVGRASPCATVILPATGTVTVDGKLVRFTRPGIVEEYTVSLDGVRQDFVVLQKPAGTGELQVWLAVTGARVEPIAGGAQLVLEKSGRKIAYSRLRVTDAGGKELTARMEIAGKSEIGNPKSEMGLAVLVDDAQAVYPIRIDPTFSDANWISMGGLPGADSTVEAVVVDGAGNLYIGGYFTAAGNVIANGIAKWNGSSWSALGSGMGRSDGYRPSVYALEVSGGDLYAGGDFTTAGGVSANSIAKWNGKSWSALGSGKTGWVQALAVSGSDLYAGGFFATAGGVWTHSIAKWNGSSWSTLGSGMNGRVFALAASGSDLYAGGWFSTAGGVLANGIAKWNGSSWKALGSGIGAPDGDPYYGGYVSALAVLGSDLYAGGEFTMAGGVSATNIAKWNGNSWSTLGSGMNRGGYYTRVSALAVSGSDLYAGGEFTMAGGVSATNIAKWNGSSWSALGSGMSGGAFPSVFTLAVSGSDLYAGGNFTTAGGVSAKSIAKWDGSSWSALGSGMNGWVAALAVSGSHQYAAGSFTTAGGVSANSIAEWNGSSWNTLGSGIGAPDGDPYYGGYVSALAVLGSDLYAAGFFTTAGGVSANCIAKWNGTSWSALGSGMGGAGYPVVSALAVSGGDLYAAGSFTTAGGVSATNIAKWNGSSWSALGSGMSGGGYTRVAALAVSGSDLYAGGDFTTAGGVAATSIAKWNGSSWSALGSGMSGGDGINRPAVYALAVLGSDLYAGGWFTNAGGVSATNIAKWNGSSWSTLGLGMGPSDGFRPGVDALVVSGSDLYAGGDFTTAGGVAATNIAKWNGNSWSAVGSGMSVRVRALAVSGSDLYAGGGFTIAGGKVSASVARAVLGDAPGHNQLAATLSSAGDMQFNYVGYPATNYALDRTFDLSPPVIWVGQQTNTMTVSGVLMFTNTPAPGTNNFWRVRSVP